MKHQRFPLLHIGFRGLALNPRFTQARMTMLTTHIPGSNEQIVRYRGYDSNKAWGMKKSSR